MENNKINKILNAYRASALAAMAHATNDIKPRKLKLANNHQSYPSTYKRIISESLTSIINGFVGENEIIEPDYVYRVENNNDGVIRLDSPYSINVDAILSTKSRITIPEFDPSLQDERSFKKNTLFFRRMMYLSFFNLMLLKYLTDEEFANLDAANNPNFPIERILEIHNEKFSHLELTNEVIKAFCTIYSFKTKKECYGLTFDYIEKYIAPESSIIDVENIVRIYNISNGRNGRSLIFNNNYNITNNVFGRHSTSTSSIHTATNTHSLIFFRGVFPLYNGDSSMMDFYLNDEVTNSMNKNAYKKLIPISINEENDVETNIYYPLWMTKEEYIKESFYASDIINGIGEEGNEDSDISFRRVSLFNNLFYILTKYMESSFNGLCRLHRSIKVECPNKEVMIIPVIATGLNGSGKVSANCGADNIFDSSKLHYSKKLNRITLNFTLSDMVNPSAIKEKLEVFSSNFSLNVSNNRG